LCLTNKGQAASLPVVVVAAADEELSSYSSIRQSFTAVVSFARSKPPNNQRQLKKSRRANHVSTASMKQTVRQTIAMVK